ELPQLFNVMAGQMSLIGPRPHMLHHTEVFDAAIPRYLYRHHVKPGMTGLAQVRGLRGEVAGTEEMKARIEQDIYYIEHWSPLLDMRIALLTLWRIIRGDDKAY
ncbi:MAG: sugar transferase, partial [Bacteroidales bacterium]|nr:sugar transferase [Bacteroidales bacterium]